MQLIMTEITMIMANSDNDNETAIASKMATDENKNLMGMC